MSKEVEEWIKKNGVTQCPKDPAFKSRTGYELAASFGASKLASAASKYNWRIEKKKEKMKQKQSSIRRKHKKAASSKIPATPKQIAFMKANKIPFNKHCTKAMAWNSINQFVRVSYELNKEIRARVERDR